jgi:hypothetical protein
MSAFTFANVAYPLKRWLLAVFNTTSGHDHDGTNSKKIPVAAIASITRGSVLVGGAADTPTQLAAKGAGKILVGDGNDLKSVTVSGEASLSDTGEVALADGIVRSLAGSATLAEVNAGKEILAAVQGKTVKILSVALQAKGGDAATATSVDIADTDGAVFAAFPIAALTENDVALLDAATVADISAALAAGKGIKIQKAGDALETMVSINYEILYCYA